MWSDRYYYFNIYADKELSKFVNTKELILFLNTILELKYEEKGSYRNVKGFPFLDMQLLNVKNVDSFSSNDFSEKETNFVSLVCAKGCENEFMDVKRVLDFLFLVAWD